MCRCAIFILVPFCEALILITVSYDTHALAVTQNKHSPIII